MSYRKKSVTKVSLSSKAGGGRTPQKLHKTQKKLAPYSPSKRYQGNTSSLSKKKAVNMKPPANAKFKTSYNKHGSKKKKQSGGAYRKHKYNPVRKKRK